MNFDKLKQIVCNQYYYDFFVNNGQHVADRRLHFYLEDGGLKLRTYLGNKPALLPSSYGAQPVFHLDYVWSNRCLHTEAGINNVVFEENCITFYPEYKWLGYELNHQSALLSLRIDGYLIDAWVLKDVNSMGRTISFQDHEYCPINVSSKITWEDNKSLIQLPIDNKYIAFVRFRFPHRIDRSTDYKTFLINRYKINAKK